MEPISGYHLRNRYITRFFCYYVKGSTANAFCNKKEKNEPKCSLARCMHA